MPKTNSGICHGCRAKDHFSSTAKENTLAPDVNVDLRTALWWRMIMIIKENYFFATVGIVDFGSGL